MIAKLIRSGFELSGKQDTRLNQGLAWMVFEGLCAAALYPFLYFLLSQAMAGTLEGQSIVMLGLAMVASVCLRIWAGRIAAPLVFSGAYAMMGSARLRIVDHLRHLPMGWFARQRAGDLGARLTSDLELIEGLWSHFLGMFLAGLSMAVFLMAFLFWLDAGLALVMLAGLPLALLALLWSQRVLARSSARLLQANANAQSSLLEYVQGMTVIRGFGRFGQAYRRLRTVLDEQHQAMIATEAKPAPCLVALGLALETGYASLLLVGAWRISQSNLSPAVLVSFLVLALPVYRQLFDVGLSAMLLRFSQHSLARVEALLQEPALPEPDQPREPQGHELVLDKVCFAYESGAEQALEDVSCVIPAHGLTAVVGPSGAGKSTLVQLMARLWDVDSGAIRLGGVDLRDIGTQALHRHVALVFQDVVLFSGTVMENLLMGRRDASPEEVVEAAKRAQAHDFIMALPQGYDTVLDEGGSSLSGGERQRLSIARALLKNAPVLLLDEATASVDPSAEADIQRAMTELARGRTVLVIAHRLRNIRHADHILVLDQGRLVEQGRHEDLLEQEGVYARLWLAQQPTRDWSLMA